MGIQTPVVLNQFPNPTQVSEQLLSDLHEHLTGLAHRTVSLSWGVLAAVLLIIGMMFYGGHIALQHFDAQLARQDVKDQQYLQSFKDFQAKAAADQAQLLQLAASNQALQKRLQVVDNKPLPPDIQKGLAPNATSQAVKGALEALIGPPNSPVVLTLTPDSKIALDAPQGQMLAGLLVDGNKAKDKLTLEQSINANLNTQVTILQGDYHQCKDVELPAANKEIAGYKKLAQRSKFRKFLDGAEKVALLAAGAYIGHTI